MSTQARVQQPRRQLKHQNIKATPPDKLTMGSSPMRDINRKVWRSPCFINGRMTIGTGSLPLVRLLRLTPVNDIRRINTLGVVQSSTSDYIARHTVYRGLQA